MGEAVLFGFISVVALAGGVGVIASRSPVHSALSLLLVLGGLAALYLLLLARFVAVLQIIIYAGAILVLFLFVIMLIHGRAAADSREKLVWQRPVALGLSSLFLLALAYTVSFGLASPRMEPRENLGTVQEVGRTLFTQFLLPFELASLILLVGILAAVVLGKIPTAGAPDESPLHAVEERRSVSAPPPASSPLKGEENQGFVSSRGGRE